VIHDEYSGIVVSKVVEWHPSTNGPILCLLSVRGAEIDVITRRGIYTYGVWIGKEQ